MVSQQEQLRIQELGDFLRTRRSRLAPSQVGLSDGERRRTPGLRRAEVAQLAGVSVDWYTWLEQGRPISVSTQVLESLVQALQLDANEREHLFLLAHRQPPPEGKPLRETVSATLQHFLDHLELSPACAVGPRWDIVAWNEAARLALYDFPSVSMRERNMVWRMFTSDSHRRMLVDWEKHARLLLARFRASYGRFPGDPWMTELINNLLVISPEFRTWWPDHDVQLGPNIKMVLNHTQVGYMYFAISLFQVYNEPDLKVIVSTPLNEGGTAAKIRELLVGSSRDVLKHSQLEMLMGLSYSI